MYFIVDFHYSVLLFSPFLYEDVHILLSSYRFLLLLFQVLIEWNTDLLPTCHLLVYLNDPLFVVILWVFVLVVLIVTSFLNSKHTLKKSGCA